MARVLLSMDPRGSMPTGRHGFLKSQLSSHSSSPQGPDSWWGEVAAGSCPQGERKRSVASLPVCAWGPGAPARAQALAGSLVAARLGIFRASKAHAQQLNNKKTKPDNAVINHHHAPVPRSHC